MSTVESLLIMVAAIVVLAFLMRRRVLRDASLANEQRRDLRTVTINVRHLSPDQVFNRLKHSATRDPDYELREQQAAQGLLLEGKPGFASPGYFFPLEISPAPTGARVEIGCRPRVPFKLWHPFAAGEHRRVQEWVRDNLAGE